MELRRERLSKSLSTRRVKRTIASAKRRFRTIWCSGSTSVILSHSRRISDSIDSKAGEPHPLSAVETADSCNELPKRFFIVFAVSRVCKGQFRIVFRPNKYNKRCEQAVVGERHNTFKINQLHVVRETKIELLLDYSAAPNDIGNIELHASLTAICCFE